MQFRPGFDKAGRNLFIGSAPNTDADLSKFDLLVLCAQEYQPKSFEFSKPPKAIMYCPLDDAETPISEKEKRLAKGAAAAVCQFTESGKKVLVTCYAGLNRSGLVTALALMNCGKPARQAISMVRVARGSWALSNQSFVKFLTGLGDV